jgi:hypothetical protein
MKKIVLLVIGLLFLSGSASAYLVNIEAPDTLSVGKPLIVTGTTTFGIGTPIDVVLYYQLTTTTEIKRKIVYVQSDYTFRTVFDTTGLKPGMYKVEVPTNGMGNSVNMRVVNLVDRSEEIRLTSSPTQNFKERISIAGSIKGDENSGVQVEVIGPDNSVIFGPTYVNTDYLGNFATDIPVTEPGVYEVSFTDSRGYVGKRSITVTELQPLASTPIPTTIPVVSAHTKASRDTPAYFTIKSGFGPVTIHTSSSIDWIVEYVDPKGAIQLVNEQGERYPERFTLQGNSKTLYIKVYPVKYALNNEVFVYAENANSITVSPTVPAPFARVAQQAPVDTPESAPLPLLGIAATGIAVLFMRRNP